MGEGVAKAVRWCLGLFYRFRALVQVFFSLTDRWVWDLQAGSLLILVSVAKAAAGSREHLVQSISASVFYTDL